MAAASIMFCAARPASNAVGPFLPTTIATTSAAPRTLSPAYTHEATSSRTAVVAHDDEAPGLAVLRRAGHPPGLEDPALGVGVQLARSAYSRTSRLLTTAR